MHKTYLIARREYLAFVRTVGFWLSLVTAPLIFALIIAVPVLIRTTAPVETMSVAILDLSGDDLEGPIRSLIEPQTPPPAAATDKAAIIQQVGRSVFDRNTTRLVSLPDGLTPQMTLKDAEAKIPVLLNAPNPKATTILVAWEEGSQLHFHIWSTKRQKGALQDKLFWDLHGLQYYKLAQSHGIDHAVAHEMRESRAEISSLTPTDAISAQTDSEKFGEQVRDNAPRLIGAAMGYVTWMTIFSSSMILLGGVIEEKASKVLEVLLASVSTESLLIGKVLGVAMVLLTVGGIWGIAGFGAFSYAREVIPADKINPVLSALASLFTPQHIALLAVYFIGGYLMYGVTFAAIGAFCETQKDAQAIMGPLMIVLMVPMLSMQAAFISPGSPIVQWLSYVPIFTPFLMPLRLAEPLPLWEILVTLAGMAVAATAMIAIGRRAFKQGALTGAKLSWGLLAKIAVRKPI